MWELSYPLITKVELERSNITDLLDAVKHFKRYLKKAFDGGKTIKLVDTTVDDRQGWNEQMTKGLKEIDIDATVRGFFENDAIAEIKLGES